MNDNHVIMDERLDETLAAFQAEKASQEKALEWQEPTKTQEDAENEALSLIRAEDSDEFQSRWNSIQSKFVDDPQASVKQAEELVSEVLERIEQAFSDQRSMLNERWADQENISTEDLRIALQSYRLFFNRLLRIRISKV